MQGESEVEGGIFLHVVPDRGLVLDELIRNEYERLDAASGRRVTWYRIGHPVTAGKNYIQSRSAEIAARDSRRAEEYPSIVDRRESPGQHHREQLVDLTQRLGVDHLTRPFIVFRPSPSVERLAILPIHRRCLDDASRIEALFAILLRELSEDRVMRICGNKPLTRRGVSELQNLLWDVAKRICGAASMQHQSFLSEFRTWAAAQRKEKVCPEDDTTVWWWVRDADGVLCMSVSSRGLHEGRVEFEEPGTSVSRGRSRNILLTALNAYPHAATVHAVVMAAYSDHERALTDPDDLQKLIIRNVTPACRYIQKKLAAQGVTTPILEIRRASVKSDPVVRIVAKKMVNDDPEASHRVKRLT